MDIISQNIKYLVNGSKIPKDTLGEEFGLKRGVIGTYISGKSKPKLDTLLKIAEYFSVSTDDLLTTDLSKSEENSLSTPCKNTNTEIEVEGEMRIEFFEEQINKLVEALARAQDNINKQMEMNAKQTEMNLKLVEALTERQSRPDYLTKLEALEQRHDKIEERFIALFDKVEEVQKKEDTGEAANF